MKSEKNTLSKIRADLGPVVDRSQRKIRQEESSFCCNALLVENKVLTPELRKKDRILLYLEEIRRPNLVNGRASIMDRFKQLQEKERKYHRFVWSTVNNSLTPQE